MLRTEWYKRKIRQSFYLNLQLHFVSHAFFKICLWESKCIFFTTKLSVSSNFSWGKQHFFVYFGKKCLKAYFLIFPSHCTWPWVCKLTLQASFTWYCLYRSHINTTTYQHNAYNVHYSLKNICIRWTFSQRSSYCCEKKKHTHDVIF